MKLRLGGAAALLAALLPAAVAAAAGPALYLDLGSGLHPAAYRARSYSDTASVRIFADLANLPSKVEGFEFYVAFPCTVTNPCAVRRDADVVSFEPDTSLIGSSERRLCVLSAAGRQEHLRAETDVHVLGLDEFVTELLHGDERLLEEREFLAQPANVDVDRARRSGIGVVPHVRQQPVA